MRTTKKTMQAPFPIPTVQTLDSGHRVDDPRRYTGAPFAATHRLRGAQPS